ncbi:MAG: hypothetical protein WC055_12420, partial [Melioribacteraceae bacterium]
MANDRVSFSLTIKFLKSGNYSISVKVVKILSDLNIIGDERFLYLFIDENHCKTKFDKSVDFEKERLEQIFSIPPIFQYDSLKKKSQSIELPTKVEGVRYAFDYEIDSSRNTNGTVTIYGYFYYYDRNNNYMPAKYCTVELWDDDTWPLADDFLGSALTNENGYFSIGSIDNSDVVGTIDLYAKFLTTTTKRRVVTYAGTETIYNWVTAVFNDIPDGNFNLGTNSIVNGSNNEGAMWIFQTLYDGWSYPPNDPGLCVVEWEYDGTGGAYYSSGGRVHLEGQYKNYPDVILHEAGHNYMWNVYGNYIPITYCPSPHYWNVASHVNCAWTEGWASFFACAVYNDPIYTATYTVNIETPPTSWDDGDEVEGRVCGSLWDIYDTPNDGLDYYAFGFDEIWDVFYNQNDDNFSQFWSAWKSYGHPKHYSVAAIYQNT